MFFRTWYTAWALAALTVGWVVGSLTDRLPAGPMARGVIAMVVAWNVSLMLLTATWLFVSPFATPGASAIPFRTVVITCVAAAVVAILLHYGATYVSRLDPGFVQHETIALGVFGSLAGVVHGTVSRESEEFE